MARSLPFAAASCSNFRPCTAKNAMLKPSFRQFTYLVDHQLIYSRIELPPRHPSNTIICYDGAVKCTTTAKSKELRATKSAQGHSIRVNLDRTQVTDTGCATLAAALDSGALPALEVLKLDGIPASAAAKEAVHAALVRSRAARLS